MPISTKVWKVLGGGLVVALLGFAVVRTWVVPALIVRAIQGQVEGKVTIRDWWLNGRSAGVVGFTVHEQANANSQILATVERVSTDLSVWRLLGGRFFPGRIDFHGAEITFRVDKAGNFLNLPALKANGEFPRLPVISADSARVVIRGEGRTDEMVVADVVAQLQPDASGRTLILSGRTDDPTWGRWTASGVIAPADHCGDVLLKGARVEADPKMLARVPFIPSEVWTHVVPRGPVDVEVRLDWTTGRTPEFQAKTEVTLLGTSAQFPTLELAAAKTTGTLRVDGGLVQVEQVQGQAIGGQVHGGGTLDFDRSPPQINLDLQLKKIKVEETPKLWQLDKSGITGLLTGKVALHAVLKPSGVDLSGSTGEANVENAHIQGIPVKVLRLAMRAQGNDLEYDTNPSADETRVERLFQGLIALFSPRQSVGPRLAWRVLAAQALVAFQTLTDPKPPAAKDEAPPKLAVQLPKTISTQIELEDVDVAELIAKAQFLAAFPFPVPVTGKLSLKAKATIPLGQLSDIKQYVFHGDATMKGASVFHVDFSLLTARLDLEKGILDLKDLRGVLVARPDGGPDSPPAESLAPNVPEQGPLPPGGFRGQLRAEIAPPGGFSARFEGNQLPLCELSAPLFPRPTPLTGLASMTVEATSDLAQAGDPAAWTISGKAESVQIRYRGAALDRVALQFLLKEGRLDLPGLTAQMAGHPLSVKGELDLKPPLAYRATLNVEDWDLASIVTLVPNAPQPSPVGGTLSAHAEARGTMSPWTLTTDGKGRIARFQAGPVPLGDVPFRWMTDRASVLISDVEARPFGGRISAEATIPVAGGGAAEGSATFSGIDTARLSASIPGQGLKLTGRADGSLAFVVPANAKGLDAQVRIASPDLTFQGIPAEQVRGSIRAHQGILKYEVTADSLGGKLKVLGDFPLTSTPPPTPSNAADGEFRFVGFALDQLWKAFPIAASFSLLSGQGTVDANIRTVLAGTTKGLWVHGFLELSDLMWNRKEPVGQLRGVVAKSPTVWRVDPLNGELLGGAASGVLWGTTPTQGNSETGFNLRMDRVALKRMLVFAPSLATNLSGLGTLQVSGRLDQDLRADVGLTVDQAQIAGLPINELRAPAVLVFSPSTGAGHIQLRQSSARFAGGRVRGDASFRLGGDRSFQGQVELLAIDLHTLNRLGSDSSQLASGRISGRISLSGTDLNQPERYRGKVNLDLDDAALFSIPVFREVGKFLGSERGGLFDDGDLVGTIANRQLIIESFTLEGRLVQLHATGTVGFDTQLNLEVLVNTNRIIPETGLALVSLIPGLNDLLGRSEQALARIGTYLSNRLVKLRVTGTLKNPIVAIDASILVAKTAATFFAGALKLPLGFLR